MKFSTRETSCAEFSRGQDAQEKGGTRAGQARGCTRRHCTTLCWNCIINLLWEVHPPTTGQFYLDKNINIFFYFTLLLSFFGRGLWAPCSPDLVLSISLSPTVSLQLRRQAVDMIPNQQPTFPIWERYHWLFVICLSVFKIPRNRKVILP